MKTSELTGAALDWAVAKCEGYTSWCAETEKMLPPRKECGYVDFYELRYSTDWAQGGPLIQMYEIDLKSVEEGVWQASNIFDDMEWHHFLGYSPLVAAMRCFVASKLGDEVDVPEELL